MPINDASKTQKAPGSTITQEVLGLDEASETTKVFDEFLNREGFLASVDRYLHEDQNAIYLFFDKLKKIEDNCLSTLSQTLDDMEYLLRLEGASTDDIAVLKLAVKNIQEAESQEELELYFNTFQDLLMKFENPENQFNIDVFGIEQFLELVSSGDFDAAEEQAKIIKVKMNETIHKFESAIKDNLSEIAILKQTVLNQKNDLNAEMSDLLIQEMQGANKENEKKAIEKQIAELDRSFGDRISDLEQQNQAFKDARSKIIHLKEEVFGFTSGAETHPGILELARKPQEEGLGSIIQNKMVGIRGLATGTNIFKYQDKNIANLLVTKCRENLNAFRDVRNIHLVTESEHKQGVFKEAAKIIVGVATHAPVSYALYTAGSWGEWGRQIITPIVDFKSGEVPSLSFGDRIKNGFNNAWEATKNFFSQHKGKFLIAGIVLGAALTPIGIVAGAAALAVAAAPYVFTGIGMLTSAIAGRQLYVKEKERENRIFKRMDTFGEILDLRDELNIVRAKLRANCKELDNSIEDLRARLNGRKNSGSPSESDKSLEAALNNKIKNYKKIIIDLDGKLQNLEGKLGEKLKIINIDVRFKPSLEAELLKNLQADLSENRKERGSYAQLISLLHGNGDTSRENFQAIHSKIQELEIEDRLIPLPESNASPEDSPEDAPSSPRMGL